MKILLLGKNGQVGWELQRALAPAGEVLALDRQQANLADADSLRATIRQFKPDWIVNAAAYTAVDQAESDIELAYKVNEQALRVLAEEALKLNAWLVHYSTDYVYDGNKDGEYIETDAVNPLSIYGKSKLAGEEQIRKVGCKHLIFRTSWVFSAKGHNFAKSMLKLAKDRQELNIVADQTGAPTSAELLADVTLVCMTKLQHQNDSYIKARIGTYHLVSDGEATWHSYAKYVICKAKSLGADLTLQAENIYPITTDKYPLPAARPKNSKLSIMKIKSAFDINLPHWSNVRRNY